MYFIHVFYASKIIPKQPQNDFCSHRHFFCTVAAPRCRRCSFLITAAAFDSSWVKKGSGGLGFRSWAILPTLPLIRIYTLPLHNYQNALNPS